MAKKRKKKRSGGVSKSTAKRPLKFLKAMATKMERNLPRLKAIIKSRGG